MLLSTLRMGDEIAVLPAVDSAPRDVFGIARVEYVGAALVRLDDGRLYSKHGWGLNPDSTGFIVTATDAHRAALAQKTA